MSLRLDRHQRRQSSLPSRLLALLITGLEGDTAIRSRGIDAAGVVGAEEGASVTTGEDDAATFLLQRVQADAFAAHVGVKQLGFTNGIEPLGFDDQHAGATGTAAVALVGGRHKE